MIMIDIEMPEKCCECPCFHAEHPMHCQLIKPPDKNKRLAAPYGLPRPDWCPLLNVEGQGNGMNDSDRTIDGFAFWIENEENGVCYIPLNLCKKIMKLLKEQEAVPVIQREVMHMLVWCCGSCGVPIKSGEKFCWNCGKKVKRDDN